MITNNMKIPSEFKKIELDERALFSKLYNLAYSNKEKINEFYEIFEHYLNDKRSEIKRVSIYALLFVGNLNKPKYLLAAQDLLLNEDNDEDLRIMCASSLAQVYFGSQNKHLITVLYKLFLNRSESNGIRTSAFKCMLQIIGITSAEILIKNKNPIIEYEDIKLEQFITELKTIEDLLQNKV